MKILVTGAAGFVGSNTSAMLANMGHEVIGLDSITDYYSTELKLNRVKNLLSENNINFQNLDLVNESDFSELIQRFKPEAVIHLAAQPGVRLGVSQYGKYISSNLVAFANTLKIVLEFEIPNFLYASSSSVYGDDSQVPYQEGERNLKPRSFYGATKLANEVLAKSISSNKTKIRGLRFFTVYGPWGRPDMAYFKIADALKNGEEFELFGDGTVLRDFTFIDDTSLSIVRLLENLKTQPPGTNDVINVGGGKPHSMLELIAEMEALSSTKLKVKTSEPAAGDVKLTIADTGLQNNLLGFAPSTSLHDGLEKFMRWHSRGN
jgi:UDP-glucuronate 4-epimerase